MTERLNSTQAKWGCGCKKQDDCGCSPLTLIHSNTCIECPDLFGIRRKKRERRLQGLPEYY